MDPNILLIKKVNESESEAVKNTSKEVFLSERFGYIKKQLNEISDCVEYWNDENVRVLSPFLRFLAIKKELKELTEYVVSISREYERIKIREEIKDYIKSIEKDEKEIATLTKSVEEKTKLIAHLETKLDFLEIDSCSKDYGQRLY